MWYKYNIPLSTRVTQGFHNMKKTHTIRWVLYHEPIHLFVRTAKVFSEEIQRLTDNRINVEVYSMKEYADKFHDGTTYDPIQLIQADEIEMSQLQINNIAAWDANDFYALEMPYLFRDHDHATRVLDGEIGQQLLNSLNHVSPVHGLAFTYSGGFRVLATDRPINTVDDLSSVNLLSTTINPVMIETAKSFGCNTIPCVIRDSVSEASSQPGVSIETTLPRYEHESNTKIQKYITNTKHSMYLTSILISKEFWNSLDKEDQALVKQAAMAAGVQERTWSVNESADFAVDVEKHEKLGISYNEFPEEEIAKLKEAVIPLYDKYAQFFSPGLIDGIIRS